MEKLSMKWTGGKQFLAADGAGHTVVTDSAGQGFKPPDLLLASVVGCAGVDVVEILNKKRQSYTSIETVVTKQNEAEPPWTIKRIEIEWTVKGKGLKEKAVKDAIELSTGKYCSVVASLRSEIVSIIRIVNEEG
jgi:putative redox protein